MDGRYPNGLLLVLSKCGDLEQEADFNRWYNHMHLPDVSAPGIFRNPMRFANADPKPGDPGYVASYETTWDDVAAAWEAQQEHSVSRRSPERMSPLLDVELVGQFKKLGGEFRAANRRVTGNLILLQNCNDPAKEEEFNRWYNDIHIPDILDTGLYHTAYRYESLDPVASKAKYLNLFETDQADAGRTLGELLKIAEGWKQQGRVFEGSSSVYRLATRRIWPMD